MPERLPVRPPTFDNMWISVPQNSLRVNDITCLAQEFAPDRVGEFGKSLRLSLEIGGDLVTQDPQKFPRGGEIFRLEDKQENLIAVAVSKYYSWNLLKNQLSFQVHRSETGQAKALSMATFEELVKSYLGEADYSVAVELAYNLVDPKFRGQQLGSKMFAFRIARANYIQADKPKLLFMMSRGAYLAEKTGNKLFSYMLDREQKRNGKYPDGRAIVTGVEVSIGDIRSDMDLREEFVLDQVHPDSLPVVRLAEKAKMAQVGLFKDLSPIYVTTLR